VQLLMGEILDRARHGDPTKIAVTLGDDELTFAQVDDGANQMANALAVIGVGYKDVVVWWSEISLRTVEGFFALARLGAAFAPINPRFSLDEAVPVLQYLHPRLLVVDHDHAEMAGELCRQLGIGLAVFATGGATVPGHDLDQLTATASIQFITEPQLDEKDPHAVFLTSGSTGVPKGVVLSHRTSWLRAAWSAENGSHHDGRPGDTICMFPLFHWAGWAYLTGGWQSHAAIHFVHRAEPDQLLATAERRRVNVMYCIPGVWRRILAHTEPKYDLSSLERVNTGTSAVTIDLLSQLKARFPGTLTSVAYGSTEGGGGADLHDAELFAKPGSVGRPNKYLEIRLADDGEVCKRSVALMDGYFERPVETAEALQDGWYHTGDLGEFDDEGFLWIIGRKREVIRSGGETIAPVEIEEAIRKLPGIRDAAVIGVPDDNWGEVVSAVLVLDDTRACPTIEELRSHVRNLAPHKHPRQVFTIDAIPRTPATGQVRRAFLRELVLASAGPAIASDS